MKLTGIPIRVRDDPNANDRRQRGHPKNFFVPVYEDGPCASNDFDQTIVPNVVARGLLEIGVGVTHTEPLISDDVRKKSDIQLYTLSEFLERNRNQYVGALRLAHIPDAEDIVQEAITNLIEHNPGWVDTVFTRKQIVEEVKPSFRQHLNDAVESYPGQQINMNVIEEPSEELDFYTDNNPWFYFFLQGVGVGPPIRESHKKATNYLVIEDPITSALKASDNKEKVFSWLVIEIFEAIKETQPNLLDLRKRYAFRPNDVAYQSLAFERGNIDEQRIADYVAFGTNNLTMEGLLSEPLFYEVIHTVLRNTQFSDDLKNPAEELPTFTPIRSEKRKIKYGENHNPDYDRLKAQSSGHLHPDNISEIVSYGYAKGMVGRSNLSRLRKSLFNQR